jgi:hypothetical protein
VHQRWIQKKQAADGSTGIITRMNSPSASSPKNRGEDLRAVDPQIADQLPLEANIAAGPARRPVRAARGSGGGRPGRSIEWRMAAVTSGWPSADEEDELGASPQRSVDAAGLPVVAMPCRRSSPESAWLP